MRGLYCKYKAFLSSPSESLQTEPPHFPVQVHLIGPGYFATLFLTVGNFAMANSFL